MNSPLAIIVAKNLRARRQRLGLTQAQVAVGAGVTVETVARLERALRGRPSASANPSLETLEQLADAVGCSAIDLLSTKAAPRHRADELDRVIAGMPARLRQRVAAVARALKQDARNG